MWKYFSGGFLPTSICVFKKNKGAVLSKKHLQSSPSSLSSGRRLQGPPSLNGKKSGHQEILHLWQTPGEGSQYTTPSSDRSPYFQLCSFLTCTIHAVSCLSTLLVLLKDGRVWNLVCNQIHPSSCESYEDCLS